ncbi:MAG: response regulator, partial [Myxococcota bacterium]|nr:response regulator [Myxococcota bacterium]
MADSTGTPRARVVVVDDSRYYRELARSVLADVAAVECCASGQEALQALERAPADLVLSDLTMPGLSGLDLLERVQREHAGTDFVLITADASVDSAVQALRRGATDYLQKPVRAEDLILVIERTVGRRKLLEENRRLRDERAILEACKPLASCLEPEEVYGVALDLVLRATRRELGIAVYHRASLPRSDGLQFRGFTESNEAALRRTLGEDKPLEPEGPMASGRLDRGPLHAALEEAGVEAGEVLALPVRGDGVERGVFYVL